jgi:hypothetical protein
MNKFLVAALIALLSTGAFAQQLTRAEQREVTRLKDLMHQMDDARERRIAKEAKDERAAAEAAYRAAPALPATKRAGK